MGTPKTDFFDFKKQVEFLYIKKDDILLQITQNSITKFEIFPSKISDSKPKEIYKVGRSMEIMANFTGIKNFFAFFETQKTLVIAENFNLLVVKFNSKWDILKEKEIKYFQKIFGICKFGDEKLALIDGTKKISLFDFENLYYIEEIPQRVPFKFEIVNDDHLEIEGDSKGKYLFVKVNYYMRESIIYLLKFIDFRGFSLQKQYSLKKRIFSFKFFEKSLNFLSYEGEEESNLSLFNLKDGENLFKTFAKDLNFSNDLKPENLSRTSTFFSLCFLEENYYEKNRERNIQCLLVNNSNLFRFFDINILLTK